MDNEKANFQLSGLKWLYDLELVQDPQLINNLKLNIFSLSKSIREVELLSSYQHKQMLIFIDVSWFGKTFLKNRIVTEVEERVNQLLPNFKLRVVLDRSIFNMAVEKVSNVLKGGSSENSNNTSRDSSTDSGSGQS